MWLYRKERGYWPSIRNLRSILGWSSLSVVQYWLRALQQAGYVEKPSLIQARCWRLTPNVAFIREGGRLSIGCATPIWEGAE